ncbi:unnamed protein product [Enterobius vermicularis]|uniref:Protein FAM50 homolog n=1 Tax=Enterobius vermicularis TaxID=51028 RepID=A0A0N4V5M2_ENTVE|nr:unnamed protein product [Enterobius vermicularis]
MSKADAGRLIHIAKKRERAKEAIEQQRKKIEEEKYNLKSDIHTKFTANYDAVDESHKANTVGLVTLDEMREKQKDLETRYSFGTGESSSGTAVKEEEGLMEEFKTNQASESLGQLQKRVLSFEFGDDEDEEPVVPQKKRLGMDPTVETSFLPDRDREKEVEKMKEDLAKEWKALQEKEKNEEINVAYAYWDGSSHRKDLKMKKGNTISQFLARALEILKREFSELRPAVPESLMFVKEDLIIPHFYTFQDFIVTRAMGKTGPLYEFDAAGEIRLRQDAAIDCGESHPAKVVLRSWYEKNKHIYPASRWEAFIPNKEYRRTIDDLTTI